MNDDRSFERRNVLSKTNDGEVNLKCSRDFIKEYANQSTLSANFRTAQASTIPIKPNKFKHKTNQKFAFTSVRDSIAFAAATNSSSKNTTGIAFGSSSTLNSSIIMAKRAKINQFRTATSQ